MLPFYYRTYQSWYNLTFWPGMTLEWKCWKSGKTLENLVTDDNINKGEGYELNYYCHQVVVLISGVVMIHIWNITLRHCLIGGADSPGGCADHVTRHTFLISHFSVGLFPAGARVMTSNSCVVASGWSDVVVTIRCHTGSTDCRIRTLIWIVA